MQNIETTPNQEEDEEEEDARFNNAVSSSEAEGRFRKSSCHEDEMRFRSDTGHDSGIFGRRWLVSTSRSTLKIGMSSYSFSSDIICQITIAVEKTSAPSNRSR